MANFTMMNWRQFISIAEADTYEPPSPPPPAPSGDSYKLIPVSSFNLGSKQTFEVPALVASVTDAFIYQQGPITVDGDIAGPLTQNISNTLLKNAVSLYVDPLRSLYIFSSLHGGFEGGKVNSFTITANAEEAINFTANVWARKGDLVYPFSGFSNKSTDIDNIYADERAAGPKYDPQYIPTDKKIDYEYPPESNIDNINPPPSKVYGNHSEEFSEILQIPMFDTVKNSHLLLPFSDSDGSNYALPISITFTINNKLLRNYVLGNEGDGLYAYSLSAAQREITGSISWQSGVLDSFKFLKAVVTKKITKTGDDAKLSFGGTEEVGDTPALMTVDLSDVTVIFDASPPPLDSGSKTTGSANFRLLKNGIIPITVS